MAKRPGGSSRAKPERSKPCRRWLDPSHRRALLSACDKLCVSGMLPAFRVARRYSSGRTQGEGGAG